MVLWTRAVLRIRDVYPGSRILIFAHPVSRIPDLGSRIQKQQQKRRVKKKLLSYLICSHKFHKIENYFSFELQKKKILTNFQRILELFTQKIVTMLWKIWVGDPGSGIRKNLFRIPDPGVKKAPDTGSRIPDLDPQHWTRECTNCIAGPSRRERAGEGGGDLVGWGESGGVGMTASSAVF